MSTANLKLLCRSLSKLRIDYTAIRLKHVNPPPRYRPPYWHANKEETYTNAMLTDENEQFLNEVLQDRLNAQKALESPLSEAIGQTETEWNPRLRRTGLIVRKIGNYPMWDKRGRKLLTTLLQVVDNHVIKYTPPEEYEQARKEVKYRKHRPHGCLLVGAETVDPGTLRKEYCGLFNAVGMLPKRILCRFFVSPEAALPTGTPLLATHFRVGDYVDIRGKTIDRGFQGVMKRWHFHGMPASHGVTKTHRRPGNIGSGGVKARVMPGTKMPGHMGNAWRILRGCRILRINTQHNVLWVLGVGIAGGTGDFCYMYDTVLPLRKFKTAPPFPTAPPTDNLPLEYYDETIHPFADPTISFEES